MVFNLFKPKTLDEKYADLTKNPNLFLSEYRKSENLVKAFILYTIPVIDGDIYD